MTSHGKWSCGSGVSFHRRSLDDGAAGRSSMVSSFSLPVSLDVSVSEYRTAFFSFSPFFLPFVRRRNQVKTRRCSWSSFPL
jgi:hypothetical protein